MKKFGILLLMAVLAFAACRKDIDKVTTETTDYVPEILKKWTPIVKPVDGDVIGFVADEAGAPVPNAAVKMGTLTTTTDNYGHFFFKNVQLNARGTYVQVEKTGYFNGSRRFFAIKDAENRVKIELLQKEFTQSFIVSDGGVITTNGGASVTFAPNSIQKEDGTPYNGLVKVAAKFLDPANLRTLDQMPGSLQGVNEMSEEVALATAGMLVVELQSTAGEKLNILKGETATIKTPVPASHIAGATAEIPLWSFNEKYGMWAVEGVSKLENGFYVGEVSHFSCWNQDFSGPLVQFTATFVDENGNPLSNYPISIKVPGAWFGGHGYTNPDGSLSGGILQNSNLVLEVYGYCNELLYSTNIGPFSTDVDLGQIVIPSSLINATTITGNLVDCNGAPIQHGLAVFKFDGRTVFEYTDGMPFSVSFTTCTGTNNIEVVGIDLDALLQSTPINVGAGGTTDLGDITVCDAQIQNYIKLTVNGVTQVYTVATASKDSLPNGTGFYFYASNQNLWQQISLSINGQVAGNYDAPNNGGNYIYDAVNQWIFETASFPNFEITQYGNTGEPIIGTFGGTVDNYWGTIPVPVTISGEINIIRDF